MYITHIVEHKKWEVAKKEGRYEPESLSAEGFIHCSSLMQVVRVANSFYKGQENLLLLMIEEKKLKQKLFGKIFIT